MATSAPTYGRTRAEVMLAETMSDRFTRLYEERSPYVYNYALRRGLTRDQAEDLVAETFLIAWRRFESAPDLDLAWLYAVARRVLANRFRRLATRRKLSAGREKAEEDLNWGLPVESDGMSARDGDTWAALNELSEPDREALALVYWDGLSTKEAARALGVSTVAFRVRLHRARKRLGAILRELEDGPTTDPIMSWREGR